MDAPRGFAILATTFVAHAGVSVEDCAERFVTALPGEPQGSRSTEVMLGSTGVFGASKTRER